MLAIAIERARHAMEKGAILRVLQDAYGGPALMVGALGSVLDNLGYPMSPTNLQFSLTYLAESDYVRVVKAKDVPGFRRDRLRPGDSPETIVMVQLTPLGLRLVDGMAPEDGQIRF
jgi:hypothetical protein